MVEFLQGLFGWCLNSLHHNPVLLLFVLLGIGYLIGNIRVAGFSLGGAAGVLFAGLFFGRFDLTITPSAQAVGFSLFIFSVGYQAGPRFFTAIKEDGVRYLSLSLVLTHSERTLRLRPRRDVRDDAIRVRLRDATLRRLLAVPGTWRLLARLDGRLVAQADLDVAAPRPCPSLAGV